MQGTFTGLMDKHFPWRITTRRVSDPPWLNDKIRRLWGKRRKIYAKFGRNARWRKLKKISDNLYRSRAAKYWETQKKVLTAEKLVDHFSKISSEFKGLNPEDIPTGPDIPVPQLAVSQVLVAIRAFRKPKSRVEGDIFLALVNRAAHKLAGPLCEIYNLISATEEWPNPWKTEYATPIPKKSHPKTPDDLRNISCTQLFSIIYESFVLKWIGGQVTFRTNQYEGVRGCGTEHYLVELWQQVLENLEDPRAASLISSIDYSKAFNRLDWLGKGYRTA